MDIKRIFAMRLHNLRSQNGVSQAELGDEIGISRGSISFYENEDRVADIETLLKLCRYFNVSADYLIGISDSEEVRIFYENNESGEKLEINTLALDLYDKIKTFMNLFRNFHINNEIYYSEENTQPKERFIPPIVLKIYNELKDLINVYDGLSNDIIGNLPVADTICQYVERKSRADYTANIIEQIYCIEEEENKKQN